MLLKKSAQPRLDQAYCHLRPTTLKVVHRIFWQFYTCCLTIYVSTHLLDYLIPYPHSSQCQHAFPLFQSAQGCLLAMEKVERENILYKISPKVLSSYLTSVLSSVSWVDCLCFNFILICALDPMTSSALKVITLISG